MYNKSHMPTWALRPGFFLSTVKNMVTSQRCFDYIPKKTRALTHYLHYPISTMNKKQSLCGNHTRSTVFRFRLTGFYHKNMCVKQYCCSVFKHIRHNYIIFLSAEGCIYQEKILNFFQREKFLFAALKIFVARCEIGGAWIIMARTYDDPDGAVMFC